MPTSRLAVWETLLWYVHEVPHLTVLDVGPGHGKAAVLLREYLNEPPEFIDAIELHPPYVEAFGLRRLYDHVIVGDARELTDRQLAIYDVVVMADVIEHLDKQAGLDLLARIPGRVVISTPVDFFSNGPGLPDSETHRSHWTEDDFTATGRVEALAELYGGWLVRLGPTWTADDFTAAS